MQAENRRTVVDAIEGFYITLILDFFHQEGVLKAVADGKELPVIAEESGFDCQLLTNLFEYVALRLDLLDRRESNLQTQFSLNPACREAPLVEHLIDQYVGGFGPCFRQLATILRAPKCASSFVSHSRHAQAFSCPDSHANVKEVVQLLESFEVDFILDIGCGGCQLLCELALRNPSLNGIGIDANPVIVDVARANIARCELAERLKVFCGNVAEVGKELTAAQRKAVDVIVAVSVANAYFGERSHRSITMFFESLRSLFPNRIMIICDYFGRLGSSITDPQEWQRTLIHDLAQVVSGQGVPPKDIQEWTNIYREASCDLIQSYEGRTAGIAWFIHVIQL
jgi:SAM-dependent methyltransferase